MYALRGREIPKSSSWGLLQFLLGFGLKCFLLVSRSFLCPLQSIISELATWTSLQYTVNLLLKPISYMVRQANLCYNFMQGFHFIITITETVCNARTVLRWMNYHKIYRNTVYFKYTKGLRAPNFDVFIWQNSLYDLPNFNEEQPNLL